MKGGAGDIRFTAWQVLRDGLPAEVTRINAALAEAGREMRLVPFAEVAVKMQIAQSPDHQITLPAVHISPAPQVSSDAPGNTSTNQAKLPYLSRFNMGLFVLPPESPNEDGSVDGLDVESALLVAMGHYRDAVLGVIRAKAANGGLRGLRGVESVTVITANQLPWKAEGDGRTFVGGLDRFTLGIAHEHTR